MTASKWATFGGDFFLVKYRITGFWHQLLQQKFAAKTGLDAGKYIICAETFAYPEALDLSKDRIMDLTVHKLAASTQSGTPHELDHAWLCFLGQRARGFSFNALDRYCWDYFEAARTGADGQQQIKFASWAVAARGPVVCFYRYESTGGEVVLDYRKVVQSGQGEWSLELEKKYDPKVRHQGPDYNIFEQAGWEMVDGGLTFSASKAP